MSYSSSFFSRCNIIEEVVQIIEVGEGGGFIIFIAKKADIGGDMMVEEEVTYDYYRE